MVDILAVFATHLPYRWVSKRANFFAPFLGWTMWLNGYVPLRRGHLPSMRRMLRRAEACLRGGSSLFVFPEGTRSPDGAVQGFFRGAFWMTARAGVPVVPVVIEGTANILPKSSALISPQLVTVSILPAVDPKLFEAALSARRPPDLSESSAGLDCREFPSEMNCTIAISADSEEELLEAAVQHAVAVHGHDYSPEFRNQLRGIFKDGAPPLKAGDK